jgi:hypothetical protein
MRPPDYFNRIVASAEDLWGKLKDPVLAGPWKQLFAQVQSPRHVLSELLQNADDAGAKSASVRVVMRRDYDLRWMSTAPGRRDFGSGISGSHFSAQVDTSLSELHLTEPYPDDSYHFTLGANLRLLDLRHVPDPTFSGQYYNADRSISCQIIDANRDYLSSGRYDGILRFSQVALTDGRPEEVVALTPEAIGKLTVKALEPLGHCASGLSIIHPDGSRTPMSAYYPKDGGI